MASKKILPPNFKKFRCKTPPQVQPQSNHFSSEKKCFVLIYTGGERIELDRIQKHLSRCFSKYMFG